MRQHPLITFTCIVTKTKKRLKQYLCIPSQWVCVHKFWYDITCQVFGEGETGMAKAGGGLWAVFLIWYEPRLSDKSAKVGKHQDSPVFRHQLSTPISSARLQHHHCKWFSLLIDQLFKACKFWEYMSVFICQPEKYFGNHWRKSRNSSKLTNGDYSSVHKSSKMTKD